jgi:hypothetical protein
MILRTSLSPWFLLLSACVATPNGAGGAAVPAANAALSTALAGGTAWQRRSDGQCYTPCTPGHACNPKTGYCEAIPCGGNCRSDERCDERSLVPHCVSSTELQIERKDPAGETSPAPHPQAP